jgi:hypothetical protein
MLDAIECQGETLLWSVECQGETHGPAALASSSRTCNSSILPTRTHIRAGIRIAPAIIHSWALIDSTTLSGPAPATFYSPFAVHWRLWEGLGLSPRIIRDSRIGADLARIGADFVPEAWLRRGGMDSAENAARILSRIRRGFPAPAGPDYAGA